MLPITLFDGLCSLPECKKLPKQHVEKQIFTLVFDGGGGVKDGMSLWNGNWHGLRNGIIMQNVIYAE